MALREEHVFRPGELTEGHKQALGLPPGAWYVVLNPDRGRSYFLDKRGDMFESRLPADALPTIQAAVQARQTKPPVQRPKKSL